MRLCGGRHSDVTTAAHVCNCIGCCDRCGHCLTDPAHTRQYCALLQRQKREREDFLDQMRKERDATG